MSNIRGNMGPGMISNASGAGVPKRQVPFMWQAISGGIGESVIITAESLFGKFGAAKMGVFAQSIAAAQIDCTLFDAELALNPDHGGVGSHMWVADTTLAADTIAKLKYMGTAYRITFTAKGIVYLLGV